MIRWFKSFWRDEVGSLTPGFLLFFMGVVVMFGAAMNVKDTRIRRNQIESVAQAIALELIRGINNPEITRNEAVQKAFQSGRVTASIENLLPPVEANMQLGTQTPFLEDLTSITYGYYDPKTLDFVEDPSSNEAVMIEIEFSEATGQQLRHRFYSGVDGGYDLTVRAIGEAYIPTCSRYGIFSNTSLVVKGDLELNDDTCVRSNGQIALRANVSSASSAVISVPSPEKFEGLQEDKVNRKSLEYRSWRNKELYGFSEIVADFLSATPSIITPTFSIENGKIEIDAQKTFQLTGERKNFYDVSADQIPRNAIVHITNCNWWETVMLRNGDYSDVVLISDCAMDVLRGAVFSNAIVLVTRSGGNSLDFRNNAVIGDSQASCSSDSGVLVWSAGGIKFRNDIFAYGTQIISGELEYDPNQNRFAPELPLVDAVDESAVSRIVVGRRAILNGSSLVADKWISIDARTAVYSCPSRADSNRFYQKHFRVALI
jgi:hypothetical protein